MPYDNTLNRRLTEQLRKNNLKYIQNTQTTYDSPLSNVGNANKDLVDNDNLEQKKESLMDQEEEMPEHIDINSKIRKNKKNEDEDTENSENEKSDNEDSEKKHSKKKSLKGGALGSKGGYAKGTIRDTGEGLSTLGAGKNKKKKVNNKNVDNKDNVSDLLLTRQNEGGGKKNKDVLPKKADIGEFKKRGRPNKMVNDKVLLGSGVRKIGGKKELIVSSQMPGSSMSGFGKKTSRIDLVKEIMQKKGLSMIEASKFIKKEGLYKKE